MFNNIFPDKFCEVKDRMYEYTFKFNIYTITFN